MVTIGEMKIEETIILQMNYFIANQFNSEYLTILSISNQPGLNVVDPICRYP